MFLITWYESSNKKASLKIYLGFGMTDSLLIRSEKHPYHVASRSKNQEFFPLPLGEVWEIMLNGLLYLHKTHGLAVHGFILMGNHFHLLCHTPRGNLDQIMREFLRLTAININFEAENKNYLWGDPYKWSIIEAQTHYYQVYRYIFQNPIRAGICEKVEDYPYSTLKEVPIPLHSFIPMSFGGSEGEVHWLNEHYLQGDEDLIQFGLNRSQFAVGNRKLNAFNKLGRSLE